MLTPIPGKRVLLVDDEVAVRNLYQLALEREGLTVLTAAGFREALQAAHDLSFDVAVVDVHLSDGDGLDLARQLSQRNPEMRVVAMSGYPLVSPASPPPQIKFYSKLDPILDLARLIKE